jgi:hypothetical protein
MNSGKDLPLGLVQSQVPPHDKSSFAEEASFSVFGGSWNKHLILCRASSRGDVFRARETFPSMRFNDYIRFDLSKSVEASANLIICLYISIQH